jgi:shikimate kinase
VAASDNREAAILALVMRYNTTEVIVLIYRRFNYDIETAIERFKKANLAAENATRLITGE